MLALTRLRMKAHEPNKKIYKMGIDKENTLHYCINQVVH